MLNYKLLKIDVEWIENIQCVCFLPLGGQGAASRQGWERQPLEGKTLQAVAGQKRPAEALCSGLQHAGFARQSYSVQPGSAAHKTVLINKKRDDEIYFI